MLSVHWLRPNTSIRLCNGSRRSLEALIAFFLNYSGSRVGVGFVEEMLASLGQRVEGVGISQVMCLFFDQK